jgi:hypothetical protein
MAIKLAPVNEPDEGETDAVQAAIAAATKEALTETGDIFANLDNLRLKQDFNRAKIKKPFNACPLRKPRRHEWFQVHQDPTFRFKTQLFALKEEMGTEWYLPVGEDVIAELDPGSLFDCVLYPWINRKSQVSLLPVQLYDVDGRDNDWWVSMREVMTKHATQGKWIRIAGGNQGYEVEIAERRGAA